MDAAAQDHFVLSTSPESHENCTSVTNPDAITDEPARLLNFSCELEAGFTTSWGKGAIRINPVKAVMAGMEKFLLGPDEEAPHDEGASRPVVDLSGGNPEQPAKTKAMLEREAKLAGSLAELPEQGKSGDASGAARYDKRLVRMDSPAGEWKPRLAASGRQGQAGRGHCEQNARRR